MITYGLAASEEDLKGILELQQKNLPDLLTQEELQAEGFVTVRHNPELLQKMNRDAPSVIAKSDSKVIGYCLAMTKKFREDIPVLIPMFEIMDRLTYQGKSIHAYRYIVSGQVCVDKAFRGQRVLDQMYTCYQQAYRQEHAFILTEISRRNPRSIKAHQRIGFETLTSYTAPDGEDWDIVIWNWNEK